MIRHRLRRRHKLSVTPDEAEQRATTAAEHLGEAREQHAQQRRARASEAPTLRTLTEVLEGNGIVNILRNSILWPGDRPDHT